MIYNCSAILSNWLYLQVRSPRHSEPVFIWPASVATARSEMKASSVSPERWEITVLKLFALASLIVSKVSEREPIWFTLIRIAFAWALSIPV